MSSNFVNMDRGTIYLLPPSIQDWLPKDHLARFVVEIVSQLNLRPLKDDYAGRGSKAYSPEILLPLLFYGYATGVFASRKLERATYDSVAFRYITVNTHPDHDTISTFRKRFLNELKPLFVQILQIAHEMNVLNLGKVSLDGTKVKANASKHHALSWEHACKLEKQLKAEVEELLRKAEEADKSTDSDGMSIPEELSRREDRLSVIAEAKAEIERRAVERHAREKESYEKKMADRKEKEQRTGKKPGGKTPTPPQPGPVKNDQVNLTDPEYRIMPKSGGSFEQAYNAQASVDMESMLIVENHVSQQPNDKQEMKTALQEIETLPEELGKVDTMVTDAGYFSGANVVSCEEQQIVPLIATERQKHNQTFQERFSEPEPLPENTDPVTKMKHRLKTQEGRKLYAKRKCTIEPVFGIIKAVLGFRQFLLRGLQSVQGEWNLVSIAWNLKRLHVLTT
ncbi:MAG: IS1182 family transposase [Thermodesulfobacteriota bacterium]|nr:IS1182 family transposase [Thermodesulfobacteriota bacterium]